MVVCPQAFLLSPVFMSRKQRSMYCEIDDPGRSIVFPQRASHRTGPVQRFVATVFGCFVPPADRRSPLQAARTPGPARRPSSQVGDWWRRGRGYALPARAAHAPVECSRSPLHTLPAPRTCTPQAASPAVPAKLAFGNVEPLRQSLAELAVGDAVLQKQLRASLAAERAATGIAAAAQPAAARYADLMGLQDEDAQQNFGSPVLPTRPASACDSEGEEGGAAERADSLARRNLMGVSQYAVQQPRQRYVHPQQSLHHAARKQAPSAEPAGQQQHARNRAANAASTKATHVSLAQLLGRPGDRPGAAPASSCQAVLRPKQRAASQQPVTRTNSGLKRGRGPSGTQAATLPVPRHRRCAAPTHPTLLRAP